jgi:TonB family protein
MYDDLARSQRRGVFERLVVNVLIPSALATVALQWPRAPVRALRPHVNATAGFLIPPEGLRPGDPVPDAFPVLLHMPDPAYPRLQRRLGLQDRVLLRALVDLEGHVDPSSIFVVHAVHPAFIASARQALSRALFRPARFGGRPGAAWVTILIDFTLTRETT